ncbi:MAG: zinc ribbon domain-containing protein [Methanoregulaceae archaeon]|nr:zinc ribbon domain-containing protein [Methanoregulaceae archaeon]
MKDFPRDPTGAPAADFRAVSPLLRDRERIVRFAPRIGIKKFRFNAYLTDRRLILIDCGEKKSGIAAKEIPTDTIVDACLEAGAETDPVLVLTIGTGEDARKMRLVFVRDEADRNAEAEEWAGLLSGGEQAGRKGPGEHLVKEEKGARFSGALLHPHPRTYAAERMSRKERPLPERDSDTGSVESGPGTEVVSRSDPFRTERAAGGDVSEASPDAPGKAEQEEDVPVTGPEIMYCHNCGKRMPKLANFCPYCGTRLHRPDAGTDPEARDEGEHKPVIESTMLRKILHR